MQSTAPSPCFFIISRARSVRYLRRRSQLTRCCQSTPAMPKFAPMALSPPCVYALPTCVRKYLTVQGGEAMSQPDFRNDLKSQAYTLELVLRENNDGQNHTPRACARRRGGPRRRAGDAGTGAKRQAQMAHDHVVA